MFLESYQYIYSLTDLTNEVTATIVPDVSEKKSSIDDTTTSDTIKTTLSGVYHSCR